MTNLLIEFMHTTAAYHAAAAQLMIGEANFLGGQLGLTNWRPWQGTNEVLVAVVPPPHGVGGRLRGVDYSFEFQRGRFANFSREKRIKEPGKNWGTLNELAAFPSQLDSNGAVRLALSSLAAVGVDTNRLVAQFTLRVLQLPARDTNAPRGEARLIPTPVFQLGWTTNPSTLRSFEPVTVELRGDTREVWNLRLRDTHLLRRATLVVTNARALLEPMPQADHFVTRMVGGERARRAIETPEKVELELLDQENFGKPLKVRQGPVTLNPAQARDASEALLAFDSYAWTMRKMCLPDYGARLRFQRGGQTTEVLLCFECDMLVFAGGGHGDFDYAHDRLAQVVKGAYPRDAVVKKITAHGRKKDWAEDFQRMFKDRVEIP